MCDFFAMLGGGIFCSAIVSWLIDMQNKRIEASRRKQQRAFILAAVKDGFIRLLERELLEISSYHSKYLSSGKRTFVAKKSTITKVCVHIVDMLNDIGNDEEQQKRVIVITPELMVQDNDKIKHILKNNLPYYENLHQHLLKVSTSYDLFLIDGIFNEQQIGLFNDLLSEVLDVLSYKSADGTEDGAIIVIKRMFFEKISQWFEVFDISGSDLIRAHYYE